MMNTQLPDILMSLIQDGKISKRTICIAAEISEETLTTYLSGKISEVKAADVQYLNELTMLIGHGMTLITEDERVKAILESLIYDYGFKAEELSRLLNIDLAIIQNLLASKEIDLDDKYLLAVKEAYLFYALKRKK